MNKKYNKYCNKGDYYIGHKFGRLTVVSSIFIRKNGKTWESFVKCNCGCGKKDIAYLVSCLFRGKQKSCGCIGTKLLTAFGETKTIADWTTDKRCVVNYSTLIARIKYNRKEKQWTNEEALTTPPNIEIKSGNGLEGKKFGNLLVIEKIPNTINRKNYWKCECQCIDKTIIETRGFRLVSGITKSCGKCKKEKLINPNKRTELNALFRDYADNAFRKNLEFNLDLDYFSVITSSFCFYCHSEPSRLFFDRIQNKYYKFNGIDRTDNNLGYIVSNTRPCCYVCNKMKLANSHDDFMLHTRKIEFFNRKNPLSQNEFLNTSTLSLIEKPQLLSIYKCGAKRRNREWKLNNDYFNFLTSQICYFCGQLPEKHIKLNYHYNGIDRLDSTLGYSPNNVVPCCTKCNRMKWDVHYSTFLNQVHRIFECYLTRIL